MSQTIACPNCNKQYKLKPELAGRRVKCTACGESFTVTSPSAAPRANAPAAIVRSAATPTKPKPPAPTARKPAPVRQAEPDPDDWMSDPSIANVEADYADAAVPDESPPVPVVKKKFQLPELKRAHLIAIAAGCIAVAGIVGTIVVVVGRSSASSSSSGSRRVAIDYRPAAAALQEVHGMDALFAKYPKQVATLQLRGAGDLERPQYAAKMRGMTASYKLAAATAGAKDFAIMTVAGELTIMMGPVSDVYKLTTAIDFGDAQTNSRMGLVVVEIKPDRMPSLDSDNPMDLPPPVAHGPTEITGDVLFRKYEFDHFMGARIVGLSKIGVASKPERLDKVRPWIEHVCNATGAANYSIGQDDDAMLIFFGPVTDVNAFATACGHGAQGDMVKHHGLAQDLDAGDILNDR